MRNVRWIVAFGFLVLLCARGCSCVGRSSGPDEDSGTANAGPFIISPADVTIDVQPGVPAAPRKFTARTVDGVDITSDTTFSLENPLIGDVSGNAFTAHTNQGGASKLWGTWQGAKAFANIKVRINLQLTNLCPGCPPIPTGKPACSADRQPTLAYPPDATLLPPNLNVIEAHFRPGSASNTIFEVSFQNAVTNVSVLMRCQAITDTHNMATGGCGYVVDQSAWDVLSQTNRGGDPISIQVRATDDSQSCVAAGVPRNVSISTNDIIGGLYYWQSLTLGGMPGRSGGIFRYDFGKRGQPVDPFLPADASRCRGCHFLSRDGLKMTFGADDSDADDEYADVTSNLVDVGSRVSIPTSNAPGFQTFSPDHKVVLASDGRNSNSPPAFFMYDGTTYTAANPAKVPSGGARGTQPDWSPDGANIVFVRPSKVITSGFLNNQDDHHFVGGSLYLMSADMAKMNFGTPVPLLTSQGENNYYPSFSPDSQFVIFNRAIGTAGNDVSQDSFYNPGARVMLMAAKAGAQPIDLPNLNDTGALTNSWPRWSPIIDEYKGHRLVWVTFSSTRDYGLRVRNSIQVSVNGTLTNQHNCYPPYSPENATNSTFGPDCHQPQLWMAAIDLTVGQQSVDSGIGDPSFPAFWLPFQEISANNHIAQWVAKIVTGPSPDGGCTNAGDRCDNGAAPCCGGLFCVSGICGLP